jgi:hypothetical protein
MPIPEDVVMNEDDRQELQEDDQIGQVSQVSKVFLPRPTFPNRVSLQFVPFVYSWRNLGHQAAWNCC